MQKTVVNFLIVLSLACGLIILSPDTTEARRGGWAGLPPTDGVPDINEFGLASWLPVVDATCTTLTIHMARPPTASTWDDYLFVYWYLDGVYDANDNPIFTDPYSFKYPGYWGLIEAFSINYPTSNLEEYFGNTFFFNGSVLPGTRLYARMYYVAQKHDNTVIDSRNLADPDARYFEVGNKNYEDWFARAYDPFFSGSSYQNMDRVNEYFCNAGWQTAPTVFLSDVPTQIVEGHAGTTSVTFGVDLTAATTSYVLAYVEVGAGLDYKIVGNLATESIDFTVPGFGTTSQIAPQYPFDCSDGPSYCDFNTGGPRFQVYPGYVLPVIFAPGETQKTITVQINGDTVIEPDEVINVVLIGAAHARMPAPNSAGEIVRLTVVNDDFPVVGIPSLNQPGDLSVFGDGNVSLSWFAVTGATSYLIEVDDSADFSSPVRAATIFAPNLSYTTSTPYPDGTYFWRVGATDGINNSDWSEVRTFSVASNNDAPQLTNPGNQTNNELDVVSLQVNATDPNGHVLTFAATGLPTGLSINTSTGLISGTVAVSSQGTYLVTVAVTDNGTPNLNDVADFTWTIEQAPLQTPVATPTGTIPIIGGGDLVLTAPSGSVDNSHGHPIYQWNDSGTGTFYEIVVATADLTVVNFYGLVRRSTYCNAGVCSVDLTELPDSAWLIEPQFRTGLPWLIEGSYVVYLNASPGNLSSWVGPFAFTINEPAPATVSPQETTNTSTLKPMLNWTLEGNAVNSAFFQVYLAPTDDPVNYVYLGWLSRAEACGDRDGTVCSMVTPSLTTGTSYTYYIQSWGPGGLSAGGIFGWASSDPFTAGQ